MYRAKRYEVVILLLVTTVAFAATLKSLSSFDLPGPAGKRFDYLTIDDDDHYLLSAHLAAGLLYVIDLRTNQVVKAIPDVPGVEGVEFVPELKKVYTSNAGDNTIGVIDLKQMKVIKKLPTEAKPDGSAYAAPEMRSREGAFYSALDADSPLTNGKPGNGEGLFYAWTAEEVERELGKEAAAIFNFRYGVEAGGNVPSGQDIEGWLRGKNILYESHSVADTAKKFAKTEAQTGQALKDAKEKLFNQRSLRPPPPVDTKIITSWNGLMISALAKASQALDEPMYLEAANRAKLFLRAHVYQPTSGRLKRRYRAGSADIDGYLDDYTFLTQGLLDLYEASFDVRLLSWAIQLQQAQDRLFWDVKQGGYFTTSGEDRSILLRTREAYDSAEPSPNSVGAMNLLRLWQMTDKQTCKDEADKTLAMFAPRLAQLPEAMPFMMSALDFSVAKHWQIVIAGAPGADDTRAMLRLVWKRYIPNRVLLLADGAEGQKQLAPWLPLLANVTRKQGRATVYVCENYVCNIPTADLQIAARLLDGSQAIRK